MNNELTLFPGFDIQQQPKQKTWHVGLNEDQQSTLRQRALKIKRIDALAILMRGKELEAAHHDLRYKEGGFIKWYEEEVGSDFPRAYEDIKIWKAYGQLLTLFQTQNSVDSQNIEMSTLFQAQNGVSIQDSEMSTVSVDIQKISRNVLLESSKEDVPQEAREDIIKQTLTGNKVTVKEAQEIIDYQKQVKEAEEQAKEDARKREEAERKLEEAEKKAREAEDKLKEQEEEEDILQELIRGLKEEKDKIAASKVETVKEDTPETKQKVDDMDKKIKLLESKQDASEKEKKKLEDDLKEAKTQKINLANAKKELEKQIKEYRENDRKHKHIEQVRVRFGQARDAIRHGLQQASARWVSPIDAEQAFEPDDWAALDQTLADLQRWVGECIRLKESVASQFVDASPVFEAPLIYIEG